MNPPTKTTAQLRADQIHAFNDELSELTREQILSLSDEQQSAVKNYHQGLFNQFRGAFDITNNPDIPLMACGFFLG